MRICQWLGRAMITIGAVTTSLGDARAQCLEWSRGFELPGFIGGNFASARVNAFAVHDDGSGSALFAGGAFTIVEGTPAKFIAKWDGASWSALSDGLNARALALAVFDDGSGPALYAAGSFTMSGATNVSHVARWNGSSWSALGDGLDSDVNVMAVFDDGSGAALYAGGAFTMSGGTSVSHIAKWDGAAWLPLGSGIDGPVDSLALFDDGSGPALCVGGRFSNAGGSPARIVAKWDGAAWSALATSVTSGATAGAFALAAHDDGSGPALFVGGRFSSIDGTLANNAAKWNGTSWSALDSGTNNSITVLKVFDDGAGPALYAGGTFTTAGGASANRIARWDGAGWSPLASGFDNFVTALAVFDDDSGAGPRLHAGGEFQVSGDAFVNKFARWDGSAWSLPSYGQGVEPEVQSLAVYDDGAGTKLYAGGYFDGTGRSAIHGIAGWDGASWSSVGGGIDGDVHALHVFDDGSGESLFVGGDFVTAGGVTVNHVAKWNGTSWSALGDGFDIPSVLAFTVFDDGTGPALYAGGHFTATTGLLLKRIAKWNGTSWSALGSGMSGFVYALEVYDSGSGPALYAGGAFGMAGGTGASNIARWNGNNWTSIGGGTNNAVGTLKVFDDGGGAGPELFAGGSFTIAGGVAATHLAKWNGSAWSGAGLHADFTVIGLEVFDDGAGDALYAGGNFTLIGGYAASRVAKFDGVAWSALGAGTDGSVVAFAAYDDGTGGGSELYLAGWFVSAGGVGSSGIARWGACRPGTEYCFGDDLDPFVTADCPCGNFGDAGHGCANSNALLGGAHLTATGTTNPNTVLFTCDGIPNNTLCTFFRNLASVGSGSVYGDGVRCLSGTGIRFGQQNSGQNGNPPNTVSSGAVTVAPGATRYYQLQYRNPSGAFCPPGLFNVSNGYRITW